MENQFSIVADECVDFEIVLQLRASGYMVYAICEQSPAINDREVLEIAFRHNALLITEDKDFGELVIRLKLPNHGILLIRMMDFTSEKKAQIVVKIISQYHLSLLNAFSVVDNNRFRTRSTN
jgi:predicted nuclease of predicted toxin-antitoxin system